MSTIRANTSTFTTRKSSRSTQNEVLRSPLYFFTGDTGIAAWPALKRAEFLEFPRGGLWAAVLNYEGDATWIYCDRVEKISLSDLERGEFEIRDFGGGLSFEEYRLKIDEIKKYLREGESYQVNFAQEFSGEFEGDPLGLFYAMQKLNPAQMAFYGELDGRVIVSNSPERLFSLRGGVLRAEPIKGTVPAGEDPSFLLRDEKSQAELTMIVDLLRNDLGRVGKNVRVPVHAAVMKLANVSHTYSVVEADTKAGILEILQSVFPGGSVTGCPKIRTMEIIERLEGFKRGAYCGCAGFVLPNGDADFNIMIRTATVAGGRVGFPAGGGILIDSEARAEYEECLAKSSIIRGLSSAIGVYETIRTWSGKFIFLARHQERFNISCASIGVKAPDLEDLLAGLVGRKDVRLKVVVNADGRFEVFDEPVEERNYFLDREIWKVKLVEAERSHPELKSTDTRVRDAMRASALKEGFDEVLLVNHSGEITEGGITNVFFIRGDTLITPATGMLKGTVRGFLLEIARESGIPVIERNVMRSEWGTFDAVFLCNAVHGIIPLDSPHPVMLELAARCDEYMRDKISGNS